MSKEGEEIEVSGKLIRDPVKNRKIGYAGHNNHWNIPKGFLKFCRTKFTIYPVKKEDGSTIFIIESEPPKEKKEKQKNV